MYRSIFLFAIVAIVERGGGGEPLWLNFISRINQRSIRSRLRVSSVIRKLPIWMKRSSSSSSWCVYSVDCCSLFSCRKGEEVNRDDDTTSSHSIAASIIVEKEVDVRLKRISYQVSLPHYSSLCPTWMPTTWILPCKHYSVHTYFSLSLSSVACYDLWAPCLDAEKKSEIQNLPPKKNPNDIHSKMTLFVLLPDYFEPSIW